MNKTKEVILKEAMDKFYQNTDDEKVSGWLAMRTGKLIPGDPREFSKIATPDDLKSFLSEALDRIADEARQEVLEEVELAVFTTNPEALWKRKDVLGFIRHFKSGGNK